MAGSAADTLNFGRSYVGEIGEDPPHSNCNEVTEWYGPIGSARCYSWCAAFVSFVLARAGVAYAKHASCWFAVRDYRSGDLGTWLGKPDASELRPGDQFFLGSVGQDHTGLVEAVDGNDVITIEGNWGDSVRRERRSIASIYGFGRPNYDVGATAELPPPSSTGGRAILRKGNVGAAVGDVQRFLNGFDNAGLTVDNEFGDATEAAVTAWQTKRSLTVDGEVGPQTWGDFDSVIAYVTAAAQQHDVAAIPAFPGIVRLGSVGPAVRAVQQRLADRGWPIRVDGGFGTQTEGTVEAFQREKGLTVDGIAGPATWVALWSEPVT